MFLFDQMTRGQLKAASRLLASWERNHAHAQQQATAAESGDWPRMYAFPPNLTMCAEYMPGRRSLLEAADPNDSRAVADYVDAAFGELVWFGPWGMMPAHVFYELDRRDR